MDNLPFGKKVLLIITACMLSGMLVALLALWDLRASILTERQRAISTQVDSAQSIFDYYDRQVGSGVLTAAEARRRSLEELGAMRYGANEYFFVLDLNGVMVMHPLKPSLDNTNMLGSQDADGRYFLREMVETARSGAGEGFVGYVWPRPGQSEAVAKLSYVRLHKASGLVIASGIYMDDINRVFFHDGILIMGVGLFSGLVVVGLFWKLWRSTVQPLAAMTTAMQRLAGGELAVEVLGEARRDEIGAMAGAVKVFKENAIHLADMNARREAEEREAQQRLRHEMLTMSDALDSQLQRTIGEVVERTDHMRDLASEMNRASEQVMAHSRNAADASSQASGSVDTVAAAAGEMDGAIREIGEQVARAAAIAATAAEDARRTDAQVLRLSDTAARIGDVVGLINQIAGQTNLLALNATIEAARAGEAGKGFAVVAGEVKMLANQTAAATGEISRQVASIQDATQGAVAAIKEIAQVVQTMNGIAAHVTEAVQRQSAVTEQIGRAAQSAAAGTALVGRTVGTVEQEAGATGRRAAEVAATTAQVSTQLAEFKVNLTRILRESPAGNRRQHPRLAVDVQAELIGPKGRQACRLVNLSEGGCATVPALDLGQGMRLEIAISGCVAPLPGIVIDATAQFNRIRFDIDAASERNLGVVLEKVGLR